MARAMTAVPILPPLFVSADTEQHLDPQFLAAILVLLRRINADDNAILAAERLLAYAESAAVRRQNPTVPPATLSRSS